MRLLLMWVACASTDYGDVCVGDGGELVATSQDCSSDHSRVQFECTATVEGGLVQASTSYRAGRDPDDRCAGPLVVSCGLSLEPGESTVVFAGEEAVFVVPDDEGDCVRGAGLDSGR
jgi:hypothetical protein